MIQEIPDLYLGIVSSTVFSGFLTLYSVLTDSLMELYDKEGHPAAKYLQCFAI
ncbi:MAG: hypothetical protein HWE22_19755 [Flavobacteriales bacterium]|nr:hypothetical protein [Flavobacteriales bacterium]